MNSRETAVSGYLRQSAVTAMQRGGSAASYSRIMLSVTDG